MIQQDRFDGRISHEKSIRSLFPRVAVGVLIAANVMAGGYIAHGDPSGAATAEVALAEIREVIAPGIGSAVLDGSKWDRRW